MHLIIYYSVYSSCVYLIIIIPFIHLVCILIYYSVYSSYVCFYYYSFYSSYYYTFFFFIDVLMGLLAGNSVM